MGRVLTSVQKKSHEKFRGIPWFFYYESMLETCDFILLTFQEKMWDVGDALPIS